MPPVVAAVQAAAAWYASAHVLVQAAVQVAVSALATAVATELAAQNAPTPQGTINRLSISSDAPRRLQIGKRANGGVLVDAMSRGYNNQWATMIIYLGEGPMGNLTGIWSGGRKVYTGSLTHGVKTELVQFRSPDARCWVTYYDGRPGQTADAATISEYPTRWTSQSVGTGCAYVVLSLRWDPDTMPSFPTMMFETEGAKMYDRRLDTTAGGSGSHRLKDPTTWELSTNPIVAVDHYLLGRWLNASDKEPVFGIGLDPSTVPYDRFLALANLADENVNLSAGGTQKRYEANGFQLSSDTYKDAILDLCRAANMRPADFGGKVSFIDNEAKASVVTLTDGDIAGNFPETYKPKKSRAQLIGGVIGTYQDINNNYAPVEYPPIEVAAHETEDGYRLESGRFDLEFETNGERAQRLARLWLNRQRRQAILSGVYGAKAMKLEDGDWFTRAGNKFGAGKVFEVIGSPVINTEQMTVAITAREVDPTDAAWDENDAQTVNIPDGNAYTPFGLALPTVTATAVAYTLPSLSVTLPAIRFENSDFAAEQPLAVEIEVAEDDGAGNPTGEVIPFSMNVGQQNALMQGILPDTDYVWRFRGALATNVSDWSSWDQVTSPSGYTFSVLWADITGPGKPADNADVTADNIAAGFTGEGALARLNGIDWNDQVQLANRPGDEALLNQFILTVAASILPNYSFAVIDSDDKPAGLRGVTSTADRQTLSYLDSAASIAIGFQGNSAVIGQTPDPFTAYGFPAVPINDKATYNIFVRHRSTGSANGLFLRIYEKSSELDTGTSHIGSSSSGEPGIVSDADSTVTLVNNGPMPGTTARVDQYTYTPTTGTKYACLSLQNFSSGVDYQIDFVAMSEEGNHDIGADVTGVNFSSGFFGEGNLAREDRASRRAYGTLYPVTSGFSFGTQSGDSISPSDTVIGVTNTTAIARHMSASITTDGSPVEIEIGAWFDKASPGTTSESPELRIFAQIRKNGSNIANYVPMANLSADGITDGHEWWGGVGKFIDLTPGAGTHTYEVRFWSPWTTPKSPFPYNAICYRNNLPYQKLSTYESGANDIST